MTAPVSHRHSDGTPGEGAVDDLDVVIIGAGLSGIDAAYHLQRRCPDRRYVILESRGAIGGTWDLFRYPGIRSDSDMHTLGFPFRPWRGEKSIADGAAIRDYVEDTARHFGIDRHIRFGHRVLRATWSSTDARWTIDYEVDGKAGRIQTRVVHMASGYYDYDEGHTPQFPDAAAFKGAWIHPQHWPEDFRPEGKRIIVIGSGATAVTLVPALVARGADVTMLQRSPTYIVSRPARDALSDRLYRWLPTRLAAVLVRWKNVAYGIVTYRLARRQPERMRALIMKGTRHYLPDLPDVERHFTPKYAPWDQRLCLVPDGDLFKALRSGRAKIVTDTIASATPTGLRLGSGDEMKADVIVAATGLKLKLFGGVEIHLDEHAIDPSAHLIYRGMMLAGVPNLVLAFGYTNASWTLKIDLVSQRLCRMLNHMRRRDYAIFEPARPRSDVEPRPMLDFNSGYVSRAEAMLPKQGDRTPWRVRQNYLLDLLAFRFSRLRDGVLVFRHASRGRSA